MTAETRTAGTRTDRTRSGTGPERTGVDRAGTDWTLTDRVVTQNGEIAAAVIGSGPPVVLTHGTPSWSYLWRHVAPALAEHHTVHLWDLPGYGDSILAPGVTPSVARHAETLAELVAHWGLTGSAAPTLVGHDIGAATVLRAHLVHGVPTRALALLDAAVLSPWVTPAAQHMQAHLDAYRTMPSHLFHEIVTAHLRTTTAGDLGPQAERAYLDHYAGEAGQQRYLDQVAGFTDDDTLEVVERLGEIAVPTALIWGEQDAWLPASTARNLAERIPTAGDPVVVPQAGHFVTEDDPAAVTDALVAFLARTRADAHPFEGGS